MKASTLGPARREKRGFLFLMLGILGLMAFGLSHDFHFSRTDMRWSPETQTVQTTIRVFTDDLELALRNHHRLDGGMKIWLGDGQEWPSADTAILGWVSDLLTLDVNNEILLWQWVGKEVELDVTYLYVESQPTQSTHWQVTNRLFFQEFEDQVNEVYLQSRDSLGQAMERREMLNWDAPTLSWKPVPSDD